MSKEILRAEGVTKQFKEFTALNNVSITLEQGKIYGLIFMMRYHVADSL